MDSREGYAVISDSFSPGELAPTTVIVDTDGQPMNLTKTLTDLPLVDSVSDPVPSQSNPDLLSYELNIQYQSI